MESITPTILLQNLPPSALGGIDLLSFTTAPKFRGIKNLPPGLHFVFVGSTSTLSVRHGVWMNITSNNPPDLYIRNWDPQTETLIPEISVTSQLQQRANLGTLWLENLTPYRQTASKDKETVEDSQAWTHLTSSITPELLSLILDPTPESWTLTSASSATQDLDEIPGLSASTHPDPPLHLLPINLRQTWREGATGRERTLAAQDRTYHLQSLLSTHRNSNPSHLVGELQFCFLMLLTLNNYSCLEQWRRILSLIFTSKSYITTNPIFFVEVLATLRKQLQHVTAVETGLFDLSSDGASFLSSLLLRFKKILEDLPGNAHNGASHEGAQSHEEVLEELEDLMTWTREELGWTETEKGTRTGILSLEDGEDVEVEDTEWDMEDELGEWAPAVVELSAEEMRTLGLDVGDDGGGVGGGGGGSGNGGRDSGNGGTGGGGGREGSGNVGTWTGNLILGNKTPNLVERIREQDGAAYADEVESDDYESEEELDLEDMDARY